MNLEEIYQRNRVGDFPDKGTIHSYIEVYEEILRPYRETAKNILEIGILGGASLKMWEQYFTGKVYGIDCVDQPVGGLFDLRPMIESGKHNILIMDATNEEQIEKNFKDIIFDVIIDDGSHAIEHQLASYEYFKPHLSKTGIYIIEDIQDIDKYRILFEHLDEERTIKILDRRIIKNRYDDVLVIIQ